MTELDKRTHERKFVRTFFTTPTAAATLLDPRLFAGVVAAGVAWTTENMFATLVVGMVTFWTAGTVL